MAKLLKGSKHWRQDPVEALRVGPDFDLSSFDRRSTPGWNGSKRQGQKYLASCEPEFDVLQEQLFAEGRTGGNRSVLLVLQGMDTAGKGGIVRHVVGMVDPQGVHIKSFGVPTEEEKQHHYLWRIRNALPEPGRIGVFDRSHYEDVLIVRVHNLVPESEWSTRYDEINEFEAEVAAQGTTIIKCAMLISPEEQRERLTDRLQRPEKHWKYSTNDINEREYWPAYNEAYQAMLTKTSTDIAPWHAIPADRKWYARLAVTKLLLDALRGLELEWPKADFNPRKELKRLAKSNI